ncbi:MAG: hypothetical protein HUJ80_04335 [Firmicutes bacterium]|nr:hypothetical protein [Bacillota bacterium]
MAFFDKVKEAGLKAADKAKDLGEQAKLSVQKEKLQIKIKDTCTEIGKALVEENAPILEEKFADQMKVINDAKAEIAALEEAIAALKNGAAETVVEAAPEVAEEPAPAEEATVE